MQHQQAGGELHLQEFIHCGVQLVEDVQGCSTLSPGPELPLLPLQLVPMQTLPHCASAASPARLNEAQYNKAKVQNLLNI